jgi:predicted ATPase/DNA-binding winged helix-turn-helix (wHTH) protein
MEASEEEAQGFAFGRFRIFPRQRRLLAGDEPIDLGCRAFDLLLALIEARGTILSKDALMARVWSGRVVEENNLHAQIVVLRKVLGTDRNLIRTVSGRGYQFGGEVRTLSDPSSGHTATAEARSGLPPTNLPEPISELIGRDDDVRELRSSVMAHRLVTLTGTGGIGKTRLAAAVARQLMPQFPDGVWIAELASVADPALVPAAVATALGLESPAGTVSPKDVARALGGQQLLVLDHCAQVIDAAAALAEAVLRADPAVRIVATSREPLNANGEWVCRLQPLKTPTPDAEDDPLQCGAVQLFFERARAAEYHLPPDADLTATVAAICRRLDGIPLAIELAAARIAVLGLESLAGALDDVFPLLSCGRRTAPARHQSLRASLDWSYSRLSESERIVLERLAIFPGRFGLDAAAAVAASHDLSAAEVVDGLTNLIAKSLVVVERAGGDPSYRLMGTMRVYALDKLAASGEQSVAARRYAEYRQGCGNGAHRAAQNRPTIAWLPGNLRCADRFGSAAWTVAPAQAA